MKAPKWLVSGATSVGLKMVRKSIKKKAKFDIRKNKPVEYIHTCRAPVLFGHAETDKVIPATHSAELFNKYPNPNKRYVTFPGDHNTPRPARFFDAVRQNMKLLCLYLIYSSVFAPAQAAQFLYDNLLGPEHKQAIPTVFRTMGNTPLTQLPNCWLVRRIPVNQDDARNVRSFDNRCNTCSIPLLVLVAK